MGETQQIHALPKVNSSMAQIMSPSNISRPTSSGSTFTTLSNNSTTSLSSTLTITSNTSSIVAPKWNIRKPQYDAKGQVLDAMSRKYPTAGPENGLSMEELLALPPLPRTFRFEMQKNEAGKRIESEDARERRKEEFEATKKKLRNLALGLK